MNTLTYSIEIQADPAHVWNTMLKPGSYEQWAKTFSEGSTFEGTWAEGETVRFIDPELGGSQAVLDVFRPHTSIVARHVALVGQDGELDADSEPAKQWVGSTESYTLSENGDGTTLEIQMNTSPLFVEMFDACWPKALENLKILAES
jgi:hypothetical protein